MSHVVYFDQQTGTPQSLKRTFCHFSSCCAWVWIKKEKQREKMLHQNAGSHQTLVEHQVNICNIKYSSILS